MADKAWEAAWREWVPTLSLSEFTALSPESKVMWRAGYTAATERAAGKVDGFEMVDPVTVDHDDLNDLCKDIAAAIRKGDE